MFYKKITEQVLRAEGRTEIVTLGKDEVGNWHRGRCGKVDTGSVILVLAF